MVHAPAIARTSSSAASLLWPYGVTGDGGRVSSIGVPGAVGPAASGQEAGGAGPAASCPFASPPRAAPPPSAAARTPLPRAACAPASPPSPAPLGGAPRPVA